MGSISASQSQQWPLQGAKPEKQVPADFDLARVKNPEASEKAPEKLIGPVESAPQDQVETEKYRVKPFDKEFKMPTLEDDIKQFVGDLDKGEKAALGGALAAGSLASGKLKVKVPVGDESSISLDIRTRSNQSAKRLSENPAELMFPDAKAPKTPGVSVGFKTQF